MGRTDAYHGACIDILNEEFIPAMGCTEPIAIAPAAAPARVFRCLAVPCHSWSDVAK